MLFIAVIMFFFFLKSNFLESILLVHMMKDTISDFGLKQHVILLYFGLHQVSDLILQFLCLLKL